MVEDAKLNALRERYGKALGGEMFNPKFKAVAEQQFASGDRRKWPFADVATLLGARYRPEAPELADFGGLDFALLKPIDTQFLISLQKVDWSSLWNFGFAFCVLVYSLVRLDYLPSLLQIILYPGYLLCGVAMMYSLMIALAATSIWLGQNQTLYDFWFYITNFSRYPMEIYRGPYGDPLRMVFTFVVPVLVVAGTLLRRVALLLLSGRVPNPTMATVEVLALAVAMPGNALELVTIPRHWRQAMDFTGPTPMRRNRHSSKPMSMASITSAAYSGPFATTT